MLQEDRKFKLIKFFRIEGQDLQQRLQRIKSRLRTLVDWSEETGSNKIEEVFFFFPNQSIYNSEGIYLSVESTVQKFQIIKGQIKNRSEGSIFYEYLSSLFFSNPGGIFTKIGYHKRQLVSKNVTIFRSLKYGLEIQIYGNEKHDTIINQPFLKTYMKIIQTSTNTPINEANCFWTIIKKDLADDLIDVASNQINHELMTLKKNKNFENMIDNIQV